MTTEQIRTVIPHIYIDAENILKETREGYITKRVVYQKSEEGEIINDNSMDLAREYYIAESLFKDEDSKKKLEFLLKRLSFPYNCILQGTKIKIDSCSWEAPKEPHSASWTGCGHLSSNNDNLRDLEGNPYKFCPYCGKELRIRV